MACGVHEYSRDKAGARSFTVTPPVRESRGWRDWDTVCFTRAIVGNSYTVTYKLRHIGSVCSLCAHTTTIHGLWKSTFIAKTHNIWKGVVNKVVEMPYWKGCFPVRYDKDLTFLFLGALSGGPSKRVWSNHRSGWERWRDSKPSRSCKHSVDPVLAHHSSHLLYLQDHLATDP